MSTSLPQVDPKQPRIPSADVCVQKFCAQEKLLKDNEEKLLQDILDAEVELPQTNEIKRADVKVNFGVRK